LGDDFAALSRILHSRYSARAFLPDPVPDGVVAEIVRVAGRVHKKRAIRTDRPSRVFSRCYG